LTRYAVSIMSVLLATGIRLALTPLLKEHHAYTLFFAAIAVTAWFAGFWPSIVAAVLAYILADWIIITPRFELDFARYAMEDYVGLASFICSALAIAFTSKALHSARERAEAKQHALAREVVERERVAAQLEAARKQLEVQAALLEQTVEERTAHLVATIHSLEGICYHLAHDLRAPLRSMQGFASILLADYSDRLDAQAQQHLKRIDTSAQRMDTLLYCLLEYGRIGHEEFALETVDLEVELREVISELAETLLKTRALLKLEQPLPQVRGNRALVREVLRELLSNGLKFVARGTQPRLHIQAETGKNTVRLLISDNGLGIAPEYHARVFHIFERVHADDYYPGTGIGLAVVAKAMQRMAGSVGLESEVGKGSRFWVEFQLPTAAQFSSQSENRVPEHRAQVEAPCRAS